MSKKRQKMTIFKKKKEKKGEKPKVRHFWSYEYIQELDQKHSINAPIRVFIKGGFRDFHGKMAKIAVWAPV